MGDGGCCLSFPSDSASKQYRKRRNSGVHFAFIIVFLSFRACSAGAFLLSLRVLGAYLKEHGNEVAGGRCAHQAEALHDRIPGTLQVGYLRKLPRAAILRIRHRRQGQARREAAKCQEDEDHDRTAHTALGANVDVRQAHHRSNAAKSRAGCGENRTEKVEQPVRVTGTITAVHAEDRVNASSLRGALLIPVVNARRGGGARLTKEREKGGAHRCGSEGEKKDENKNANTAHGRKAVGRGGWVAGYVCSLVCFSGRRERWEGLWLVVCDLERKLSVLVPV